MAGRKSTGRVTAPDATREPSKAELQRRMEEAREEISDTVAEIKESVTEQVESVKETVSETLDWRAQFRKHSVAWSLGALGVGYVVGSGIAAALKDTTPKKGRKDEGWLGELSALAETIGEEFSVVAQTLILPAITKKIRDKFGIDISERLLAAREARRASSKGTARKAAARKGGKKAPAKKRAASKRTAKKGGAK